MKYKLGEKHPTQNLYRVVALKDFGNVKEGEVGGWVEGEHNLSQDGNCWVSGHAQVSGNCWVYGDALPKREWVGLTDEEKEQATGWSVEHIEAKLKEKNT